MFPWFKPVHSPCFCRSNRGTRHFSVGQIGNPTMFPKVKLVQPLCFCWSNLSIHYRYTRHVFAGQSNTPPPFPTPTLPHVCIGQIDPSVMFPKVKQVHLPCFHRSNRYTCQVSVNEFGICHVSIGQIGTSVMLTVNTPMFPSVIFFFFFFIPKRNDEGNTICMYRYRFWYNGHCLSFISYI